MRKFTSFLLVVIICLAFQACKKDIPKSLKSNEWSFVFMTDIHLMYDKNAENGFKQALSSAINLKPELILTGGDLIFDALEQPFSKADSFYNLYNTITSEINIPVYNTLGNHEVFGWYNKSGVDRSHLEFGKKMYQNRIGKTYYTFMHNGWCFIILDSVEELPEGNGYYGKINDEQVSWLKSLLANTDKKTPIIVTTHIPFATLQTQLMKGSTVANPKSIVIENSMDIFNLFNQHNLQLVLQGHLHIFEDLLIYNTRFITGGAVSGAWWKGPYQGNEEGFVKINITDDKIQSVNFIDYGWNVSAN